MMTDAQKLRELLSGIYGGRSGEIRISPAWLATEAMASLDPTHATPALIYRAAHMQFRQLVRSLCRQGFEEDGECSEQHAVFPGLQARYPAAHSQDAEPEYVQFEHLTDRDVEFNVNRLRSEGRAKQAHADKLEAWDRDRVWKRTEAA